MVAPEPARPRRLGRPRWLDVRVIGGVLLLAASVVVGARVIGASSHTSPVWVATHDLATGTVLTGKDVTVAEVNLGERSGGYLDASASLSGRMLGRPVRAGELVPASALGPTGDGRIISVAVGSDRMAPGVQHGSVVDLYLVTGRSGADRDDARTELLRAAVTVQSVEGPAAGGLSGAASSKYHVAVLLSPEDAQGLLRRLPAGDPWVVLHTDRDEQQSTDG